MVVGIIIISLLFIVVLYHVYLYGKQVKNYQHTSMVNSDCEKDCLSIKIKENNNEIHKI